MRPTRSTMNMSHATTVAWMDFSLLPDGEPAYASKAEPKKLLSCGAVRRTVNAAVAVFASAICTSACTLPEEVANHQAMRQNTQRNRAYQHSTSMVQWCSFARDTAVATIGLKTNR
jgi:murein endopeptidase